jgi:hypothetical protein
MTEAGRQAAFVDDLLELRAGAVREKIGVRPGLPSGRRMEERGMD